MILLWVTLLVLHQVYSLVPVITVQLDEPVTFTCPLPNVEVSWRQFYWSQLPSHLPPPGPCTCPAGSVLLKDRIPEEQYEELAQRRAKEFQQYKARTTSVLSKLLFAAPNSPLQYPIQGFTVQPLTTTHIPGLALYAEERSSYKVSLSVSKGILTTEIPAEGVTVQEFFMDGLGSLMVAVWSGVRGHQPKTGKKPQMQLLLNSEPPQRAT
ncbi:beta-1,4 N-acetylgalactosaminyltransferase 2-like protein [Lates japonicus]|uniref:Beta-1,4 N-acetylgalactosaminyltransferase 2-like protein n=1 Tax=Lates japonicus TaxID=270547 RepID=A0AAD3NGP1_LATJO|nr:beta-1,4 N-acetylgalactosaminyltransferase 2-like protein [Lates japonicus]